VGSKFLLGEIGCGNGWSLEKRRVICVGYGVWGMRWYLIRQKGGGGRCIPSETILMPHISAIY